MNIFHHRQVLNYRYNIRGWLTRINNSDLSVTEGGPRDYFGMDLYYHETTTGLSGYQPQYNGNISAMKWSSNLGLGITAPELGLAEPKENAYTFNYDTLNRLKSASFHTKASAWSASTAYHEKGLKYDLNGNIRTLNRTTTGGVSMDQLSYTYTGNQLQKVSDASGNAKGFTDGTNPGSDYVYDVNGNLIVDRNKEIETITYNHLNLPDTVRKNSGDYIKYIYDAAGIKLRQEVYDGADALKKKTNYAGEFFYENDTLKFINHEEGRVVMTGTVPEYQYHLKDHLGNVRMTFTTVREVDEYNATLETSHATAERAIFSNYDNVFISTASMYNHTVEANSTRSVALNGANGKQVGLAKSLRIVPGDTINMKVFAKYFIPNPNGQPAVGTSIISAITGAFGLSANSTGPEYSAFESLSEIFETGWFIGPDEWEDDNAPKAYLNYILFDEDFVPYDMGWDQIDAHANSTSPHDTLRLQAIARKPGYAYIYFSNEDDEIIEVYFDDLNIDHVHSPVVQADDYYPFGLTFNSYDRENALINRYKFQGQEHIEDLNWDSFKWRNHQPDIGRFFNVDPISEQYYYNSPYAFSENKVTSHVELEGLESKTIHENALDQELKKLEQIAQRELDKLAKLFELPQQKGKTEIEKKNSIPEKNSDEQREQIKPNGTPLNIDGTTPPQYNPDAKATGDPESKEVMTQDGGMTSVENASKPGEVKIDTTWGDYHTIDNADKDSVYYYRNYELSNGRTGTKLLKSKKGATKWLLPEVKKKN